MKTQKFTLVLVIFFTAIFFFSCKTQEIILHGEIAGLVTDASTTDPIKGASVKLNGRNDTTITGNDGEYMFKNLIPDDYEIQVSKSRFFTFTKNITVASANSEKVDFLLTPLPQISASCLDFGLDLTSLSFTISNPAKTDLIYLLTTSQGWITIFPSSGEIKNETNTITVTVDKSGLHGSVNTGIIKIISASDQFLIKDTIYVGLNGLLDARDLKNVKNYKVVKIGTQTWMAENLNIGKFRYNSFGQLNNEVIEKYCYDDNENNCNIYGGLYTWSEAMQYKHSDDGIFGTTQGICPDGWHIPTKNEWGTLIDYLGGYLYAGGKLKDTSALWHQPNTGATNESGFSALPGGAKFNINAYLVNFSAIGEEGTWLSSYWLSPNNSLIEVLNYFSQVLVMQTNTLYEDMAYSVRCIKNQGKR
jgi:uncharacterized protein (TIGR02145 family)